MSPRFTAPFRRLTPSRLTPSRASSRPAVGAPVPPASPPATRPDRQWWRDTRVVVGSVFIIGCMLIGARLVSAGSDEVMVWQVNRDLAAGAQVASGDLQAVALNPQLASHYWTIDSAPRLPLGVDVRAGELLSPASFVSQSPTQVRWITVPVEPLHAPVDLAPGQRVDLWSTPDTDLGDEIRPVLVLADLLVTAVDVESRGFATDYGVIVEVSTADAQAVLTAIRAGSVDLVGVPFASAPDAGANQDVTGVAQS